jgi:hypothetical protein
LQGRGRGRGDCIAGARERKGRLYCRVGEREETFRGRGRGDYCRGVGEGRETIAGGEGGVTIAGRGEREVNLY